MQQKLLIRQLIPGIIDSQREFKMRVAIVGCGYVFDHYMSTWNAHPQLEIAGIFDIDRSRLGRVSSFYSLKAYSTYEEMLSDESVQVVCNFTSIESHYEVTKAALLADKHVYSEKPLVTDMNLAKELFALADSRSLRLSCAPSNALSDSVQTMWRVIRDGVIGDVRVVYAEFDDNVIYKMYPETWRSKSGAPWPYIHEYEMGCTYEHVGYHLTWLCSLFGPVESVTAFSKEVFVDKTDIEMHPAHTPDFSVACLNFQSGVVARVTCSIGVPYDHRMRVVGSRGMISVDTYRHYKCPVYLEIFDQITLNFRKARFIRNNSFVQWLLGIGGRKIALIRNRPPGAKADWKPEPLRWWSLKNILKKARQNQLGQQDKVIGIAELCEAISTSRPHFPSHDFTLHLTELTLLIQNAGVAASAMALQSSFVPPPPVPDAISSDVDYQRITRQSWLRRKIDAWLVSLHQH